MKELIGEHFLSLSRFKIEKGPLRVNSLFFITEGEIEFSFGKEKERAGKDTLVSFPCDVPFERKILSRISFFHLRYLATAEERIPLGKINIKNSERVRATVQLLHSLENADASGAIKNALLADFFVQAEAEAFLEKVMPNDTVEKTQQYLQKNLQQKISLPTLAAAVSLSPTGLIHHFKKHTGKTPMAYLAQLRLAKAEALLTESDVSIAQIALLCGFECPYYFSNAFKKAKGVSPAAFRKQHGV